MTNNLEATASKADKALPGVEVKIGGKDRILKYSLYSLCKLDEKTGKNPLDGSMFSSMRPFDIAAVIWAGLLHEDKTLEIEEIMEGIEVSELREVSEAMMKAFAQSAPDTEDSKKNSTKKDLSQEPMEVVEINE